MFVLLLTDFEASFVRLLDKLTTGSRIEIDETGTRLKYKPGFLKGGRIEHDCGTGRAIGWFVEGILPLAPFGKAPLALGLTGITNDDRDFGVDTLRAVTLPLLKVRAPHENPPSSANPLVFTHTNPLYVNALFLLFVCRTLASTLAWSSPLSVEGQCP